MSSSSAAFGAAHGCSWGQRSIGVWEHCLALMAQLPPALHVCATPALGEVQCVTPRGASPPLLVSPSVSPVSIGIQRCPLATEGPGQVGHEQSS